MESFFKVTDQIPKGILGNSILLNRIPSFGSFCEPLVGPVLCVVLRAHQNMDHTV